MRHARLYTAFALAAAVLVASFGLVGCGEQDDTGVGGTEGIEQRERPGQEPDVEIIRPEREREGVGQDGMQPRTGTQQRDLVPEAPPAQPGAEQPDNQRRPLNDRTTIPD